MSLCVFEYKYTIEMTFQLHLWTFEGNDVLLEREVNTEQSSVRMHMLGLQVLLGYSKVNRTAQYSDE